MSNSKNREWFRSMTVLPGQEELPQVDTNSLKLTQVALGVPKLPKVDNRYLKLTRMAKAYGESVWRKRMANAYGESCL